MKVITIIIPVFNAWKYTASCLASILKSDYPKENYEILVVDNASTDGTETLLSYLQEQGEPIKILRNKENVGYLLGANQGWKVVETQFALHLNNDVILDKNCISQMFQTFDLDPKIGIVGAIRTLAGTSIYPPKITFFRGEKYKMWEDSNRVRDLAETTLSTPDLNVPFIETDIVPFACALVKKEVWEKIGYFDEEFAPTMYDQENFTLTAKEAGFKTVMATGAKYIHIGAVTTSFNLEYYNNICIRNKVLFHKKWGDKLRRNEI